MLKGIDRRLNADVLGLLRRMGHGDRLVLADANFPADSTARQTVTGQLFRMENLMSEEAAEAILSLMPLDSYVPDHAVRMEVIGAPDEVPRVQRQVQAVIDAAEGRAWPMLSLERFAFYEAAKASYAVIQTGDPRAWGCFIFRKGVLLAEG